MKLLLHFILVLTSPGTLMAQQTRYFRVSAPVAARIQRLTVDGYLTWTNAPTTTTFMVQTAASLIGESNWVDYVQVPVTNSSTTVERLFDPKPPPGMVLIPAGSFTMGDTFNEDSIYDQPTHSVYVSAFYMDRYEVTKELWDKVYQWAIAHGYAFGVGGPNFGLGKDANHPVHSLAWWDVVKWCNARSEMEGKVPAYYRAFVQRTGTWDAFSSDVNWARGYRLPTEAEWEKAARGGLIGKRFPWGDTITHGQANYASYWVGGHPYSDYDVNPTEGLHPLYAIGDIPYTSPAGSFDANGYALYDMAGNVYEWCWDYWSGSYSGTSQIDPRGPIWGTWERVIRGGGWANVPGGCRSAARDWAYADTQYNWVGFRCVLTPGQ